MTRKTRIIRQRTSLKKINRLPAAGELFGFSDIRVGELFGLPSVVEESAIFVADLGANVKDQVRNRGKRLQRTLLALRLGAIHATRA